jgi:Secretion system C-terminal sorting domain
MKRRISKVVLFFSFLFYLTPWQALSQSCTGKDFSNSKSANGSFEFFKNNCLTDIGLITSTNGPTAWESVASFSASIHLNTCSSLGSFHPVDNTWGSQSPRTGNADIRIRSGPCSGLCIVEDAASEYSYLKQDLATPLLKGVTYYIEFYVSLADISRYGVNSLGMYLTNNPNDFIPQSGQTNLTHLTPQIPNIYPSATSYLDSNGWTKICGFYTPMVDGVKYIVIGNFRGVSNYSTSNNIGYKGKLESIPYYYIDDVYIGEYSCCPEERAFQNSSSLPSKTSVNNTIVAGNNIIPQPVGDVVVQVGQNVAFKAGNSVFLKPGFKALLGSTFSAKIGACEKGLDNNQLKVSIQTIISGTQITLTPTVTNGSGNYVYNWSNGATSSSITVPIGFNTYTLVVTDLVQDSSYPSPCNSRVGWAQYVGNCPTCRISARIEIATETEQEELVEKANKENNVSVYPNPSAGVVNIKTTEEVKLLTILNSIGSAMENKVFGNIGTKEIQIDMGNYPKGSYIFQILMDTGEFINKQVIIK